MTEARSLDYDQIAHVYSQRYTRNKYPGTEQCLTDFAGGGSSKSVLEVGCGTGHWLEFLARQDHEVIGLDVSRGMLEQASRSFSGCGLLQGRAEKLPLDDESIDRVFCISALHHFVDKPAFIRESFRILRGGGLLTAGLDPHQRLATWWVYDYFPQTPEIDRRRYPSAEQIRQWMASAGFRRVETFEAEHLQARMDAQQSLEEGLLDRSTTSQLTVLSSIEYEAGIARIIGAIAAAKRTGATLELNAISGSLQL